MVSLTEAVRPPCVRLVEVGPRDGLQNIQKSIPTTVKLELISRLVATGLTTIELTSVVSPRAVPQQSDCRRVLSSSITRALLAEERLRLPVLVPNLKGLEIAFDHGLREVAVFVSASEGFSKANTNCSVDQGLSRAREIAQKAIENGVQVRAYVSCIFADPSDGPTPTSAVVRTVQMLLDMGCYEVSLGDTLGVGTPADVQQLLRFLEDSGIPVSKLAGHFHDTYGHAVSNVWQAYQRGIVVFDSSVAGLGGCPYCPGSKGNVATEDLVAMFHGAGVKTDVDLSKLLQVKEWIIAQLDSLVDCQTTLPTRSGTSSTDESKWTNFIEDRPVAGGVGNEHGRFTIGYNLQALWRLCKPLWQTTHRLSLPMGT